MICRKCSNIIDDYILYDERYIKTSISRKYCYSCKPYRSNYYNSVNSKNKRLRFKIKLVMLKGGKCNICNYNKNLAALQLHHLDPNKKEFNLSHALYKTELEIIEELSKCILLCANCHLEHHNPKHNNWQENNLNFLVDRKIKMEKIF